MKVSDLGIWRKKNKQQMYNDQRSILFLPRLKRFIVNMLTCESLKLKDEELRILTFDISK